MATSLSDKLCIAWSGTYESLKQFVSEDLQLKGTWEQPGGDRKLFSCDTSTILWRKNKGLLSINGENATEIMRELCKRMCNYHANNSQVSASAHTQLSNELSDDVHTDIEDLKLGQQINGEAIQSLSASISYITSHLQDLVNKNKTGPDISALPKQPCVSDELTDYVDAVSVGVDNSFVIQESTNPRTNNGSTTEPRPINREEYNNQFNELNGNASVNSIEVNPNSASADVAIEDNNNTKAHHPTYAEKTANQPATKKIHQDPTKNNLSKKSEHTSQSVVSEAGQSPDDFIGVQRKRGKTKKLFVTGIAESVSESQILSYLNQRNIFPTYISVFRSRRRETLSCKLHIPSGASALVEKENFWPTFVTCKPWRPKDHDINTTQKKINSTQNGSYSTLV